MTNGEQSVAGCVPPSWQVTSWAEATTEMLPKKNYKEQRLINNIQVNLQIKEFY